MNISMGLLSAVTTSAPSAASAAPLSLPASLSLAVSGILIVLIALALLAVMVLGMNKIVPAITGQNKPKAEAPTPQATPAAPAVQQAVSTVPAGMVELPANQSQGEINLYSVDDKTAAMIMAIVSDTTQIPLNELYFKSIKEI